MSRKKEKILQVEYIPLPLEKNELDFKLEKVFNLIFANCLECADGGDFKKKLEDKGKNENYGQYLQN